VLEAIVAGAMVIGSGLLALTGNRFIKNIKTRLQHREERNHYHQERYRAYKEFLEVASKLISMDEESITDTEQTLINALMDTYPSIRFLATQPVYEAAWDFLVSVQEIRVSGSSLGSREFAILNEKRATFVNAAQKELGAPINGSDS
jgi:alkanesulfonate monooxygenase SsuD/methylene tetrahydromethanopterin reductase-like flavin-dependent oxidoreductase (luciferase family)